MRRSVGQGPARLSILRPYERGKIPVVLVHGLWGSERQWDRMVRDLEADEAIRGRYQFWTFGYATGDSDPVLGPVAPAGDPPGAEAFDPGGTDEAFDRMVVVGHSLGGLVAKMTAQTTGPKLWGTVSASIPTGCPALRRTSGSCARRSSTAPAGSAALIFIATPHRGSPLARGVLGDLGTRICRVTGSAATRT